MYLHIPGVHIAILFSNAVAGYVQETRRLVTAVWQHIVYEEYLPILLGEELFIFYQLGLSDGGKCGHTSHQLVHPSSCSSVRR